MKDYINRACILPPYVTEKNKCLPQRFTPQYRVQSTKDHSSLRPRCTFDDKTLRLNDEPYEPLQQIAHGQCPSSCLVEFVIVDQSGNGCPVAYAEVSWKDAWHLGR